MGVRQAVVIVHGMGEQRPHETVKGLVGVAIDVDGANRALQFSRPGHGDRLVRSRRLLAPRRVDADGVEVHAQTEFYDAMYFSFPDQTGTGSSTAELREALDLACPDWLEPTIHCPEPDVEGTA